MGLFSILFSSRDNDSDIKVRESREDCSKVTADKFTHTGGGTHVHENYTLDRESGSYKEYRGGENSSDRSYNKK